MKKENKYETIEMLDLEDKAEDIVDIFIDKILETDKTVGLIANREIAEYLMDFLLDIDEISIRKINLPNDSENDEFFVSVTDNGELTVVPIEEFSVLDSTDIFYIDMDGDIEQNIINYCVNWDKEVILFGQAEDEDDDHEYSCGDECGKTCNCGLYDGLNLGKTPAASYKVNGKSVDKETYEKAIRDILLRYCKIQDEMNEWRKLLNW